MRLASIISISLIFRIAWTAIPEDDTKKPTVLIGILVRNKAHTLPYFLSLLERLQYPKDRIQLWIRSDNNIDKSNEILSTWLETNGIEYHDINVKLNDNTRGFDDENGIADWSERRFLHVINLREEILNYARNVWADFVFMLDSDVFLTHPGTIDDLISKNKTVVAPLLKSDGMYSNYWTGMTDNYYYLRTDKYEPILNREETGCFDVPMIHSAVLIDLRKISSDYLTYRGNKIDRYDGPTDDIITFALAAKHFDIPMHICNDQIYGYIMVPLEANETLVEDNQRLTNIKVEMLAHTDYLPVSEILQQYITYPKQDTMELDNIYMINLLRRPERRKRMKNIFIELGIRAETIDAVDGSTLNKSILQGWGMGLMPEYADPYRHRPMTMGEIGCFLSHYVIWTKVMQEDHNRVLVLEDDVRFEPFFRQKVDSILVELENLQIEWDLVYFGRKRLVEEAEPRIPGSKYLVRAGYSYWTLGYLLSSTGAKKLVEAMPLKQLVPVDEYLPILSDAHPRNDWKKYFPKRDLIVLSTNPLLIYPTHYTGEQGYISDTENSKVLPENQIKKESQQREDL